MNESTSLGWGSLIEKPQSPLWRGSIDSVKGLIETIQDISSWGLHWEYSYISVNEWDLHCRVFNHWGSPLIQSLSSIESYVLLEEVSINWASFSIYWMSQRSQSLEWVLISLYQSLNQWSERYPLRANTLNRFQVYSKRTPRRGVSLSLRSIGALSDSIEDSQLNERPRSSSWEIVPFRKDSVYILSTFDWETLFIQEDSQSLRWISIDSELSMILIERSQSFSIQRGRSLSFLYFWVIQFERSFIYPSMKSLNHQRSIQWLIYTMF